MGFWGAVGFIIILLVVLKLKEQKQNTNKEAYKKSTSIQYNKKNFLTNIEMKFYHTLIELEKQTNHKYKVIPQVNLGTIVEKFSTQRYRNELFRNIDFVIFDAYTMSPLLLIELNDQSHVNNYRRIKRDRKVKNICESAGYELMNFWCNQQNEQTYVINRILKVLEGEVVEVSENKSN